MACSPQERNWKPLRQRAPHPLPTLPRAAPKPGLSVHPGALDGYLVALVAPPSAHPVGPHRGEEGQVVAIGLRQEHRLPWVQGEAGAGVPLLGDGRAQGFREGSAGDSSLHRHPPTLCPRLRGFSGSHSRCKESPLSEAQSHALIATRRWRSDADMGLPVPKLGASRAQGSGRGSGFHTLFQPLPATLIRG